MIESLHVLDLAERRVLTRPRATLLGVLRDKFLHLGRGEDGAALVVTLAIFFLMYLGCMGVYAISMAVKERIHLQNAVDAAAYSAAVVQADTLSRIATINRAMSWTYVNRTGLGDNYAPRRLASAIGSVQAYGANWYDSGYTVITKVNAQERMLQIMSHLR